MKLITIGISIEHEPDEDLELVPALDTSDEAESISKHVSPYHESFEFSITEEIEDAQQSSPHVERIIAEVLRRYKILNARKTN